MGPVASISTCFRKYANFSGRAARPEFWWFMGFQILGLIVLAQIDSLLFPIARSLEGPIFFPLMELFALALILPTFAVTARRIQDSGSRARTALVLLGFGTALGYVFTVMDAFALYRYEDDWFLMTLSFVALAAFIAVLLFALKKSAPGENEYGPNPRELSAA